MEASTLSVVVIGRNEGRKLADCLASVHAALAKLGAPAEIVYVDSRSEDGSVQLAQSAGARTLVLKTAQLTAAAARNLGWRATSTDVVLFLDGDTVLDPDFLAPALAALAAPQAAVVFGNRRERRPERSPYMRALDLDWIVPPGDVLSCGGDALMRREALLAAGGYDDGLVAGEEPDLCARLRALGFRIVHLDQPMTTHDLGIVRLSQYWRRAQRTGRAYADVDRKLGALATNPWRRKLRRNYVHGLAVLSALPAAAAACLALASLAPLAALLAVTLAVSLRTAFRHRWKTRSLYTLACYAVHSHAQKVPILLGQLGARRRANARS